MNKEQQRLINFLEEDIIKLQKNVDIIIDLCNNYLGNTLERELQGKEDLIENIDIFFSYWTKHINKLKTK
tara:strand:+ start:274 stop:483 length:210 start_codon:yes stop_codon:yes gene_type:complete